MHPPEHLAAFKFRCDFPICTLSVPVAELAQRFGIEISRWHEPGLGNFIGFVCKLASGLVVFLEECDRSSDDVGSTETTVHVEASELIAQGVEGALAKVLSGLGLSRTDVTWSQSKAGLESARQTLQSAQGSAVSGDA
jgi:hypothetical protein